MVMTDTHVEFLVLKNVLLPHVAIYRDFFFQARKQILSIHTGSWQPKLNELFIDQLAEKCAGKLDYLIYSYLLSICTGLDTIFIR